VSANPQALDGLFRKRNIRLARGKIRWFFDDF
jgi:hypothetical protein